MNAITRITLAACLTGGSLLAPAAALAVPAPTVARARVPIAVSSTNDGPRLAELQYAARERAAGDLEPFQGGAVLVIGASVLVIVLVVLLIVVIV